MKLTFYRGPEPNFGDELNAFMWDKLLPSGFLDGDADDLFIGIGSIIWDFYPAQARKHVIGSGYGGYTSAPDVKDGTWQVAWVRGPLTAEKLGLDASLAITDAAVLLRAIDLPAPSLQSGPAFMPHFESVARGNWRQVCEMAGITYLDPRADPMNLISKIRGASVLVTEAMHGAIVADAMRTPFIPVTPTHPSHRYKWEDWARSVELDLKPVDAMSSSLLESYTNMTGLQGKGARSRALFKGRMLSPVDKLVMNRTAAKLRQIAADAEPHLSNDAVIARVTERSQEALDRFVQSHRRMER